MANIDSDERTNATGLFNTARSYWRSAEQLRAAPPNKVTHPEAPITFLFCHAIELYLKAYLRGAGRGVAELRRLGHRVADLAKAAADSGLILDPEQSEIMAHIEDTDTAIEARYIVTGFKNRPTTEAFSSVAEQLDQRVCAALAQRSIPVRQERFERTIAQDNSPPEDLEPNTIRVLSYLFSAIDHDACGVSVIAHRLNLKHGMVQYHLDRLDDLKFAMLGSVDMDDQYWMITAAGRKYAVRHGLHR
jgi:hypothetical protein